MDVGIEFRDAARSMTGLTASLEARTVIWLAERLPRRVNSAHLTSFALAAMFLAGASYWLPRSTPAGLLLVNVCLVVNWFGDSLDGTLARVRGQQRPRYGYYVDHIVDLAGTTALFAGVAASGLMQGWIALGLVAAFFLVAAESYLATHTRGVFRLSFA